MAESGPHYGEGKETVRDTFETNHRVTLFFYDPDLLKTEFPADFPASEYVTFLLSCRMQQGIRHWLRFYEVSWSLIISQIGSAFEKSAGH